jgi:hypothetical protein
MRIIVRTFGIMKNTITINNDEISTHLSYTLIEKDTAFIGHITALNIPFTSPTKDKASDIAKGLVKALFHKWGNTGGLELIREKIKSFNFTQVYDTHYEYSLPVPKSSYQM